MIDKTYTNISYIATKKYILMKRGQFLHSNIFNTYKVAGRNVSEYCSQMLHKNNNIRLYCDILYIFEYSKVSNANQLVKI